MWKVRWLYVVCGCSSRVVKSSNVGSRVGSEVSEWDPLKVGPRQSLACPLECDGIKARFGDAWCERVELTAKSVVLRRYCTGGRLAGRICVGV